MLFVGCSSFQLLHYVFPGQLLLAKGDLDQSSHVFKIVLDGSGKLLSAHMALSNYPLSGRIMRLIWYYAQACVEFNRGHFQESLELYKVGRLC